MQPHLDSSANANILETEHVDVKEEAATISATASLFPQEAGGVDQIAKNDWTGNNNTDKAMLKRMEQPGNVTKEAKEDKLKAESKRLLLLADAPQHHDEQGHLGGADEERGEEEDDHEGDKSGAFGGASASCYFVLGSAGTSAKFTAEKT